jgi:hypothetical protein
LQARRAFKLSDKLYQIVLCYPRFDKLVAYRFTHHFWEKCSDKRIGSAVNLLRAVPKALAPEVVAAALHDAVAEAGVGLAAAAAFSPSPDHLAALALSRSPDRAARRGLIQASQPTRASRPETALLRSTSAFDLDRGQGRSQLRATKMSQLGQALRQKEASAAGYSTTCA